MYPVEVRSSEKHSGANAELVLPVTLKVSKLGVEVVGLNSA